MTDKSFRIYVSSENQSIYLSVYVDMYNKQNTKTQMYIREDKSHRISHQIILKPHENHLETGDGPEMTWLD